MSFTEIEKLKGLRLHDQSIESIYIDIASSKLHVVFEILDDKEDTYNSLKVSFHNISQLQIENFDIKPDAIEVYSCKIDNVANLSRIVLLLLIGPGKPSASISFLFETCELL